VASTATDHVWKGDQRERKKPLKLAENQSGVGQIPKRKKKSIWRGFSRGKTAETMKSPAGTYRE